jgi:MerR family transcriptional regulator, light-induced transcriptional regulator
MQQHEGKTIDSGLSYRSGVAGRLAGIPVETLRVWERRYRVVGPRLSERGQRLYSPQQIKRLATIKQLVDLGHPIGAIAGLTNETLAAMRAGAGLPGGVAIGAESTRAASPINALLIGPTLFTQAFDSIQPNGTINVVGRFVSISDCLRRMTDMSDLRASIIVVELPTMTEQTFATLDSLKLACGAQWGIVLYRFAPSDLIRRMRALGYQAVRAPADHTQIESLCCTLLPPLPGARLTRPQSVLSDAPMAPRFDAQSLATLSAQPNDVYCECPSHLAELVLNMTSFERYSTECASASPQDEALHRELNQMVGRARMLLEDALIRVVTAEGLILPANRT